MTNSLDQPHRPPGRLALILGLLLPLLGIAGYAVQLGMKRLWTPWYLPAAATLGLLAIAIALWQRRSLWRWLALVPIVLLAGASWFFLLATRLPTYTGPLATGQPFPPFATARADGSPFTQRDLVGPDNTVLVFFRGRW